ncbi:MAG: lactate racemase domain-containing protein [Oscillospiraceae bacterium]
MYYDLPSNSLYGDEPINVFLPDNWDVHVSQIRGFDTPALTAEQLHARINSPIGAKTIAEGAAGAKSAVIIFDDITRPTPTGLIAKHVIAELNNAGVENKNIWFVAAIGAHGVMNRSEFVHKLGEDIVENFEIYNHNAFTNCVFLGNTSHRVPVEINADVMSADYKIAIGSSMAHAFYGFGGGAKIVLPGVSSIRTIQKNHSYTSLKSFNMGNPESMIKNDAEEAARMMGLDFKIDAIINGHGEVCALFAGDVVAEGRAASEYGATHYLADFVPDCDLVISNVYLKPAEACCGYTPETIASMKDGGDYILAANSPFGPATHYLYDKWGHSEPGGWMWSGYYDKTPKMKNCIVFAQNTVRGIRDSMYLSECSGAVYKRKWEEVLALVDDGSPKKVVIYPMSACCILTNSKDYYDRD